MDLRLVIGSLFFAGISTAQVVAPAPALPPATTQEPKAQDPDRPAPSPTQQAEELAKEKARLQQEIDYARNRAKNAKALLREKFMPRTATHRSIDAGVMVAPVAPAPAPVTQPRPATILSADELGNHPQGTLLVVNGRPIAQANYDQLMTYLAALPNSGDENMRTQRAMFELIRNEAVAGMFEDNEAAERAGELQSQLEAGKSMAELVKTFAAVPGGNPDGTIEVTRNSVFGPLFEMVAFQTQPGSRSRPFRTVQGIVMVQVDKLEKGASSELDKVIGHAILVPYTPDAELLNKAQIAVTTGQIELRVRDQKTLDALPAIFRPAIAHDISEIQLGDAAQMPTGENKEAERLQRMMKELAEQLSAPFDGNDAAAKERRAALEKQYAELKTALAAAQQPKVDAPKVDAPKVDGNKK